MVDAKGTLTPERLHAMVLQGVAAMISRRAHAAASTRSAFAASPLLICLVLSPSASAATVHEAWLASGVSCFARAYDSHHLASHPLQRLTRFSLRQSTLGNPVEPGSFAVSLSFTLKGDAEVFQSEAFCEDAPGTVHCVLEADGGRFTLRADGSGMLLNIERIEVEGPESFSPNLAVGGDDRTVRLHPAPRERCPGD